MIAAELAQTGPANADTFRFMRRAVRIKSADLAELLGVSVETLSRWENGHREPDRAAWVALSGSPRWAPVGSGRASSGWLQDRESARATVGADAAQMLHTGESDESRNTNAPASSGGVGVFLERETGLEPATFTLAT